MQEIPLQEAETTLSAVIDRTRGGAEFVITRHGRKEAVVISWEAWERLSKVPSLGALLAAAPIEADDLPVRSPAPLRDVGL
ncbi:type II toxin-antitoxin system Phd/YefM family antitoxin [Methylobacterium sp. A54F]